MSRAAAPTTPRLLPREHVALMTVALGFTHEAASRRLGVSPRTLRRAVAGALKRLGAVSPAHAVALAAASGQLDLEAVGQGVLPDWGDAQSAKFAVRKVMFYDLIDHGRTTREAAACAGIGLSTGARWRQQRSGGAG